MNNHRYPPARAQRQRHVDRAGCRFGARGGTLTRLRQAAAVLCVLLASGAAAAQAGVVQVVGGSGAMVFVDGTFAGVTNEAQGGLVVLDVAPGERLVRVVADGVVVVETAVEVSPGAVTTVIAHSAQPTSAEPAGAEPAGTEPGGVAAPGAEPGASTDPPTETGGAEGGDTGPGDSEAAGTSSEESVVWQRQFSSGADDRAYGLATVDSANIVVVGATQGRLAGEHRGGYDAYVRIYDAVGAIVWEDQFGTNATDIARAVAVDAAGRIVVAGETRGDLAGPNAGENDAFVRVYDASGAVAWQDQFGTSGRDVASAVAIGADGRIVIAGEAEGSLAGSHGGGQDGFVRVYGAAGELVWQDQLATSGPDAAYGVALDAAGNVAVVGYTGGDLAGPQFGGGDAFIRVYDAAGAVLWQDQFGTGSQDVAWDVTVDALGRFVVIGDTRASLFQAARGDRDGFARVYDPAGSVVWQRQFGSVSSDTFRAAVVDGEGHVIVVGGVGGNLTESGALVATYLYVRMYDAQGSFKWQELIDGTGSGSDRATAAVVDGLGRLVLAGNVERDLFGLGRATGSSDAFVRVYERPGGVVLSAPR